MADRDKISGVLLIVLIFAAISLIFVFSYKNSRNFEHAIVTRAQQHLLTVAETQANSIKDAIGHVIADLLQLSEEPELKELILSGTLVEVEQPHSREEVLFEHFNETDVRINGLYRLDRNGIVQSRIPFAPGRVGADFSDKADVKYVLETHRPYVSGFFQSDSGKKVFFVVSAGI